MLSRRTPGGNGTTTSTRASVTEPAFRATFQLTATVPADWVTIGNMPIAARAVHGKLATTTFERSPRMPSYLVQFSAGDLRELRAQSGKVRFGVWAVAGRESEGAVALANARQILARPRHSQALAGPEDAEGGEHDADGELERVFGHPSERPVHDEPHHSDQRAGGEGADARRRE